MVMVRMAPTDDAVSALVALSGVTGLEARRMKLLLRLPQISGAEAARLLLMHLARLPISGADYYGEIVELLEATGGVPDLRPGTLRREELRAEGKLLLGGGRVVPKDFRRASGECVCATCSEPYWRHSFAPEFLSWEGQPFLRRLCNGDLVKL